MCVCVCVCVCVGSSLFSRPSLSPEQHVRKNVHNCEMLSSLDATNCTENGEVL